MTSPLFAAASPTRRDIARSAVGGSLGAVESMADTVSDGADAISTYITGRPIPSVIETGVSEGEGTEILGTDVELPFRLTDAEDAKARGLGNPVFGQLDEPDAAYSESDTLAGEVVRGLSQFFTGFKAAGVVIKNGSAAATVAKSAIADFTSFDPQSPRLSNLVEDLGLYTPVTDYLAADPDDGNAEGRFKAALEGAALGPAVSGLFRLFKHIKGKRAGGAWDETSEEEFVKLAEEVDADIAANPAPEVKPTPDLPEGGAEIPADVPLLNAEGLAKRLQILEDEGGIKVVAPADVFNFERMDSPGRALDVIEQTTEMIHKSLRPYTDRKSFAEMQLDALEEVSGITGENVETLTARLIKTRESADKMTAHLLAGKTAMQSLGREIDAMAHALEKNASEEGLAKMYQMMEQLGMLSHAVKGLQTSAARTTAAGRIVTTDGLSSEDISRLIQNAGGMDAGKALARRIAALGGDPAKLRKIQEGGFFDNLLNVHNEYYINALLSSPATHLVNAASNALQSLALPMERVLGGDREGLYQLMYWAEGLPEAFKGFGAALKAGDNILDPHSSPLEHVRGAVYKEGDDVLSYGVRALGEGIRMPSRLLLSSDEFFKQIQYRSALKARLHDEARQKFPGDAKARAKYVTEGFLQGFDPKTGKGTDASALELARTATFTNDLLEGTLGHTLQQVVNKHPVTRVALPFVRTPTNLFRNVMFRTPGINLLYRTYRDNIAGKNGAQARSMALGQMAMGTTLYTTAYTFAAQGRITGAGPSDPDALKRLQETGWQPHSFVSVDPKTGKKAYISYNRSDPQAMFFGLVANLYEMQDNLSDAEVEEVAAHAVIATLKQLNSKTYLQGLTRTLSAFTEPERKFQSFLKSWASSYVPAGAQALSFDADDTFREAFTVLERIQAKVPGYSKDLPARINWVTGHPMLKKSVYSPWAVSTDQGDTVAHELAKYGKYLPTDPVRMIEGVELTAEQYSKFLKHHAHPPGARKSLHQRLWEVMQTPKYKAAQDPTPDWMEESYRVRALTKVIDRYRDAARKTMYKGRNADPLLAQEIRARLKARKKARREAFPRGQSSTLDQVLKSLRNRSQ